MAETFCIEYVLCPPENSIAGRHQTDNPDEVDELLMHLLLTQSRISSIRRDGVILGRREHDAMLKRVARRIVAEIVRGSLQLDPTEIRSRFGLAA
jgi:hypothetical protein